MNKKMNSNEMGCLLKGHLKFAILKALEQKPLHGYAIINRIAELTTVWKPTTGSMYPMLLHLEKEGLVVKKKFSDGNRQKKIYSITVVGLKELKSQEKMIEPMIFGMTSAFHKLLSEENIEEDHLLEFFSKSDFLKKELFELKNNFLEFVVLNARGKISKENCEKVRQKLKELNGIISVANCKKN